MPEVKGCEERWAATTTGEPQVNAILFIGMGQRCFISWNMIHSFHSFLATGCQSARCNSRIHFLCYEGAGSRESRRTSQGERTDRVWSRMRRPSLQEKAPRRACLSSSSLSETRVPPTAILLLLLLLASCSCVNYKCGWVQFQIIWRVFESHTVLAPCPKHWW